MGSVCIHRSTLASPDAARLIAALNAELTTTFLRTPTIIGYGVICFIAGMRVARMIACHWYEADRSEEIGAEIDGGGVSDPADPNDSDMLRS